MEFSYSSRRWKAKRLAILKRDKYLCVNCKRYGKHTEATVVHHIEHVDKYPELAFTDSNLQSLCVACHNRVHPEKATRRAIPPTYR